MNWEIDVFGRVREGVKAKNASYNVSRADYDAVIVSLCAEVASEYMQLRMCQEELRVAKAHIASQEHVVKITEARFEAQRWPTCSMCRRRGLCCLAQNLQCLNWNRKFVCWSIRYRCWLADILEN